MKLILTQTLLTVVVFSRLFYDLNFGLSSQYVFSRGVTSKCTTSCAAYFRDLATGQHSSEKTPPLWRTVVDSVSDLTRSGIEPQTYRADSDVFNFQANRPVSFRTALRLIRTPVIRRRTYHLRQTVAMMYWSQKHQISVKWQKK